MTNEKPKYLPILLLDDDSWEVTLITPPKDQRAEGTPVLINKSHEDFNSDLWESIKERYNNFADWDWNEVYLADLKNFDEEVTA